MADGWQGGSELEIQWKYREAHGRYEGDTEGFWIRDPEKTQEGDTRRWGVQGRYREIHGRYGEI
jgi:hypothetical protein